MDVPPPYGCGTNTIKELTRGQAGWLLPRQDLPRLFSERPRHCELSILVRNVSAAVRGRRACYLIGYFLLPSEKLILSFVYSSFSLAFFYCGVVIAVLFILTQTA